MAGSAVTCSSAAMLCSPAFVNHLCLNAVELQITAYLHISNMAIFAVTCGLAGMLYAIHIFIYQICQDML